MTEPGRTLDSYRSLSQEVYDLTKPEPPDFILAYYLGHAKSARGPILEPMCGSGRYLIPLLERGFDVDGMDASPHMLRACQQRCAEKSLSPALYRQFLSEMALPRQYALVLIPAASFVLITGDEEIEASLERLYEAMLPGAKLLLEIEVPAKTPPELGRWHSYWVERPDGSRIVVSSLNGSYDETTHTGQDLMRYELVQDGKLLETEFEFLTYRAHTVPEFAQRLAQAGFADVKARKCWGGFADREPDEGDPRAVFECCRPE